MKVLPLVLGGAIAISCVAAAAAAAAPTAEKRLISLREGHQEWMTQDQIFGLLREKKPFVDVTDGEWSMFEIKQAASHLHVAAAAPSYPSKSLQKPLVTAMINTIDKSYLKTFLDGFTAFNNRYYTSSTGVQSAQYLFDELTNIKSSSQRTDVALNVTKFSHSWQQFSVIATLSSASDTGMKDRVILGAHQDSINSRNPSAGRAPGFDDDGSGVANNLAALKAMLANPTFVPGRPIEFHFYAAEEVGLRGSQKIAAQYVTDKISVYGMLNSDMTGYPSSNPLYAIVTDYANPELTTVLRFLAKDYTTLPVVDTRCGYACSDHASWNKAGFPVAHHHEATIDSDNPNIHGTQDVFSYISLDHAVEFLKTTIAFAVEMSLFGK